MNVHNLVVESNNSLLKFVLMKFNVQMLLLIIFNNPIQHDLECDRKQSILKVIIHELDFYCQEQSC